MKILTIACWSHEIKYHLFSWDEQVVLASGNIERVGLDSSFIHHSVPGRKSFSAEMENDNLQDAIALILATLTDRNQGVIAGTGEISAVGHRVAHGGTEFHQSVQIDSQVLISVRNLHHFAPLHCASNVAGIEAAMKYLPDIPHVATFDTAFHLSMPDFAYIYPLPYEWYEKHRVRRYGFHGPSHLYLSRRTAVLLQKPAQSCNLITIHLDRGVSLCAIKDGQSIDTSMGMTPLEGVMMETRCGDIDPGIHAYIMKELSLTPLQLEQVLNHKSGILGVTDQRSDRQAFLQAALQGESRSKLALEMETYRIKKYIGSFLAIIGPLDGIVFSAGSGGLEWIVREMVLDGLECFGIRLEQEINRSHQFDQKEVELTGKDSSARIFVIPANEELIIAEDVAAICSGI